MAYKIYLYEETNSDNWTELDCEDVDFSTVFAIADIADISKRKDNATKTISFKGTKKNNEAFGSLFFLNRFVDFNVTNSLFFNYSSLRPVDCLIYEDSILVFRGKLRVLNTTVTKNGDVTYNTMATGSFIEFRDIISEKQLEDLDFSDLNHYFNVDNIKSSWSIKTQRYNANTNSFYAVPYQKGSGYVYPFMDYGVIYNLPEANLDRKSINHQNFRPAIYLKEYFNKIFSQEGLNGFSYEIDADAAFKKKFDSLIIPNNEEMMLGKATDVLSHYTSNTTQVHDNDFAMYGDKEYVRHLKMPIASNNPILNSLVNYYVPFKGEASTGFIVKRTFTSTAFCSVKVNSFNNKWDKPVKLNIELCERDFVSTAATYNSITDWNVIQSVTRTVNADSAFANETFSFAVGERTYKATNQLAFRIHVTGDVNFFSEVIFGYKILFNVGNAEMRFPQKHGDLVQYEITDGDVMNVKAPVGIKQIDFLKSVLNQFNLYVYSTKEQPKHLIFRKYDDYYAKASISLLKDFAIDWTNKIDYNNGINIIENVQLPKKYLFTYKEDGDFLNDSYKKKYSEVYGSFRFSDDYGLTAEKKVELIFSPTPAVTYANTGRIFPAIYQLNGDNKKPFKSNIRMLFYNGLKKSGQWFTIGKDSVDGRTYTVTTLTFEEEFYGNASHYYLQDGINNVTPIEDLNFGLPRELYIDATTAYTSTSTAYQNYFKNQISELTNPNVQFLECKVYLNEIDIANLDLSVPVFINMNEMGNAYFKVLNVEYENNNTTSKVTLQKIPF